MSFEHNFLVKPTAAIHIRNTLTITQRKIANILLKEAFSTLDQDVIHSISLTRLIKFLGWKEISEANQLIRNSLKELNSHQIEWNIFNKDKTHTWGVTTFLAHARISKGILEYSYSKPLREMLYQPNIFARLDLEIQKNFSNKHALALWEYLSEHLCANKTKNALLEPLSLEQLRHFLGIQNSKAYSSFFLLNAKVLQPAVAEINQYSDLLVTCQYIKQKKKVIAIAFEVKKRSCPESIPLKAKSAFGSEVIINHSLFSEAEFLHLEKSLIEKHLKSYGHEKVATVLKKIKREIQAGNKIRSPIAYYLHCLKNTSEETDTIHDNYTKICKPNFLELAHNNQKLANVLQSLSNKIGPHVFSSWFQKIKFEELDNHTLKLKAKSKFYADYINLRFSKEIIEASKDADANFRNIEVYTLSD